MVAAKAPQRLAYARSPSTPPAPGPTIDDDSSGGAAAPSHDVLGHAGVVGRVRQAGLADDEVVVDGEQEVGVLGGVDDILVLEPFHLQGRGWWCEGPVPDSCTLEHGPSLQGVGGEGQAKQDSSIPVQAWW